MKRFLTARLERPPEFPLARRRCDLVVVSAAADGEWPGFEDLLDSLATYLACDYEVVVTDDATQDGIYERLLDAGCWVIRNPTKLHLAGNNLTLRRALSEAHRLFDAPLFLKLDPDALVIGPGLPAAISDAFACDPRIGLVGAYHLNWDGSNRDLSYWQQVMLRRQRDFQHVFDLAIRHGYIPGDGVQGGAYALSRGCVDALVRNKWLYGHGGYCPSSEPQWYVAEDSLIAMLTFAAGYTVAELGGPCQAFGLAYRGLPMPVDELVRQNRLVTHSLKYTDQASLEARAYFRQRRRQHRAPGGSTTSETSGR